MARSAWRLPPPREPDDPLQFQQMAARRLGFGDNTAVVEVKAWELTPIAGMVPTGWVLQVKLPHWLFGKQYVGDTVRTCCILAWRHIEKDGHFRVSRRRG